MLRTIVFTITLLALMVITGPGCRRESETFNDKRQKVVLQTDWYAQPEHGGFYQALAKGYYAEEGLDVTILQGGPNAMSTQKVIKGTAHFAMHRADAICLMAYRGVDVQLVMATLQHDPQGIMLHASNPIESFKQLDGARIMAVPGLSWIQWIEATYDIKLDIVPHDFGLQRFLNDESFIQQCLVTNEPFYAELAGANPRVMRLRDSGFDPYHGIYCLASLIDNNPELVNRFVKASIRGWRDFILADPRPALELIAQRNPRMTDEFMEFCLSAMVTEKLVTGSVATGQQVGQLDRERLQSMEQDLKEIGLLESGMQISTPWFTTEFTVKHEDAPLDELP